VTGRSAGQVAGKHGDRRLPPGIAWPGDDRSVRVRPAAGHRVPQVHL